MTVGLCMDFEQKNLEMCQRIILTLLKSDKLKQQDEALYKLRDPEWVKQAGYAHVAHVLASDTGEKACRLVFLEYETSCSKIPTPQKEDTVHVLDQALSGLRQLFLQCVHNTDSGLAEELEDTGHIR